ncbi:MAG: hypothetical protein JWN52_7445 [Actinomycetia bacterium]|nr:hypothetical protein [Actinomycetes bacterium]
MTSSAWTILNRHALAVLSELPGESIDCVITDPPYNSRVTSRSQENTPRTRR